MMFCVTMVLKGFCHLYGSGSVSVGLHHADELGFGFQERTVVIEVIDNGIEVDLKDGLVHLLLQLFRNTVETEVARTLNQNHRIVQLTEDVAAQEFPRALEEMLFLQCKQVPLRVDTWSDGDEMLDATLDTKAIDLAVEVVVAHAALVDVAENQRALGFLATSHKVEGDIERIDVGIIRVVDEDTAVLPFLHFQSHGNRFEVRHTLAELFGSDTQVQCCGSNRQRTLHRSLINERQLIHRQQLVTSPTDALSLEVGTADTTAHEIIVGIVYDCLRIVEQLQFLHTFFLQRTEILLMRCTDRRQHANSRLDDVCQSRHLTRLTDASLKQAYLRLFVQQPNGQRHTDLRIETLGRTRHAMIGRQHLIEPLFDHRLTIRTRNTHHGNIKLITMALSQSLQGFKG